LKEIGSDLVADPESILRDGVDADAIDTSEAVYRYAASGVVPRCVVHPANPEAVAGAVSAAGRAGLALVPAGHPTHLDVGAPPRRYDAALAMRRMNRILAHDAADMTVTAEAGVTLGELRDVLTAQGQWLPLDPARAGDMTVGGLIAADRSGPLRFAFGKVREWLIGLKVVTANGALVQGGGRVVKNVAGYDLPKLFAGSFGTLGVIVEATFKVRPLPPGEALFLWPAAGFAEALAQGAALVASPVVATLVEVLNEAAAETLGFASGACVVAACAGSATLLEEHGRRLATLSDGAARRMDDDWAVSLRRALSDFSHPANEDGLVARISALPTALGALLPRLEAAARERRIVAEIAAHAGSGVAWCQFLGALDDGALADLAEWTRRTARAHGAWVVWEMVPEPLRARIEPWGYETPAVRLMAGVKRALDPNGVFSPGRFVGGI
jgi:glycolate oxidase FAD binding subunit